MSEKLFQEFNKTSDEQWLEQIEKDLKGKTAHDIAKARPYEGIDLKVFYSEKDRGAEDIRINIRSDWQFFTQDDYLERTMADPINYFVRNNAWVEGGRDMDVFASIYKSESGEKLIGIDASIYQQAGASADFELASTIAQLNEYLHDLKEHKELKKTVLSELAFKVGIGADYFLEMAKLRALRILVRNLAKAYEIEAEEPIQIYAQNSLMHFSSKDVDTNILRSTTAGMSAVAGGCDHLILEAHDSLKNKFHDFGDRIARNIQLLMKHESHLDKVGDPAAGSYFVEALTRELANKAWSKFKEIENKGGLIKAFEKKFIQEEIGETAKQRIADAREERTVLVGVNKYTLDEKGSERKEYEEKDFLHPLYLEKYI